MTNKQEKNLIVKFRDLINSGLGHRKASDEIGIPRTKGRSIFEDLHLYDEKGNKSASLEMPSEDLTSRIKTLLDENLGAKEIAVELGISSRKVRRHLQKIREDQDGTGRVDDIRNLLESGEYDTYDLAKKYNKSPKQITTLVSKANFKYDPMKDWVINNCSNGVRTSTLETKLELIGKDKAKKVLQENFEGFFILESKLPDGDTLLTPVKDSKDDYEWINVDVSKRKFDIFSNQQENYVCINIKNTKSKDFRILNFSDVHIGAKANRLNLLKSFVKEVENDDSAFAVFGGDMIEAITKASVGDPYEQYLNINEQMTECIKIFRPIAHKLIAYAGGNHDSGRTYKTCEFDLSRAIASILKVPYFRGRGIIDIYCDDMPHRTISLTHKYGKALSRVQILAQVRGVLSYSPFPIHCFFSGHNHDAFIEPIDLIVKESGVGLKTERIFVANAGSFMARTGTYAELEGYAPTPQDLVYFEFNKKGEFNADRYPIKNL